VLVDVKFKPDAFKFSVICTGNRFQFSYAFTIGLSDPVESRLSSWSLGMYTRSVGTPKIRGSVRSCPLKTEVCLTLINMPLSFFCYLAEFSRCRSNRWASEGSKYSWDAGPAPEDKWYI